MTTLKKTDAIAAPDGSMSAANGVQVVWPPGRRRLSALDGLRGTAILAVLTCHAHLPLMYFSEAAASHWGLYDPKDATWIAALALITVNAILASSIALASFHLYEKQFLKMKHHFPESTGLGEHAGGQS